MPLPVLLQQANLRRAYNLYNEEILEGCAKQAEFRSIVFALCYFHAALLERKKFGVGNLPGATSGIGWNMNYPFNAGDLLCCGQTANNYLENNVKVSMQTNCFGGIVCWGAWEFDSCRVDLRWLPSRSTMLLLCGHDMHRVVLQHCVSCSTAAAQPDLPSSQPSPWCL